MSGRRTPAGILMGRLLEYMEGLPPQQTDNNVEHSVMSDSTFRGQDRMGLEYVPQRLYPSATLGAQHGRLRPPSS